ncbi:hypothetical protein BC831DRAFT_238960 [Entophlyctis helioformis]|nr:hypothetical protein BC831DRAFT_238960 [Entophlyctis helioformis]
MLAQHTHHAVHHDRPFPPHAVHHMGIDTNVANVDAPHALPTPTTPDSMAPPPLPFVRWSPYATTTTAAAYSRNSVKPVHRTEEKRASHNAIERARRESLNHRFQDLANTVPSLSSVRKPSKSIIVQRSLEYVSELRRIIESKDRTAMALRQQNNEMRDEITRLRSGLGMPPLNYPDILDEDPLLEVFGHDPQQVQQHQRLQQMQQMQQHNPMLATQMKKRNGKLVNGSGMPILSRNNSLSADMMYMSSSQPMAYDFGNFDDDEDDDESVYTSGMSSSVPNPMQQFRPDDMASSAASYDPTQGPRSMIPDGGEWLSCCSSCLSVAAHRAYLLPI